MKKIALILITICFYSTSQAQLGYKYGNDFITLSPSNKSIYYIQSNEDITRSEVIGSIDNASNISAEIISMMKENCYFISASQKPISKSLYISDIYHNNIGTEIIIHPRIVLKLKKGHSISSIVSLYSDKISIDYFDHEIYHLSCTSKTSDEILTLAMSLNNLNDVDWCEPVKTSNIKLDINPLYNQQYYLKNTGQSNGTSGIDINAEGAWAFTKGNPDVIVAVIDDGVDFGHEDLAANLLQGYTVGNPNGYGAHQNDNYYVKKGHGTACAGIVAAVDNTIGIIGVASGVKILPVNIVPYYGNSTNSGFASDEEIADAIRWAYNRADVLSCSWGRSATSTNIDSSIQEARTLGRDGKGCVVVFSSGNYNDIFPNQVSYPANLNGVMTVGAIDNNGTITNYSQRGSGMDVVAPGNNIVTTDRMGTYGYNTDNYTYTFSGTSASCPQVAGVAALILSKRPDMSEAQVRGKITATACDLGSNGYDFTYGYGLVNAGAALDYASATIIGATLICDSASYSVTKIPSNVQVYWSMQNLSGNANITINPQNSHQCTVTYIAGPFHAKLVASVYDRGVLKPVCFKEIHTLYGNYGTYSQESCTYYGKHHQAISPHPLTISNAMYVHQGCIVTVSSPYFEGATVTHMGVTPEIWGFDLSHKVLTFSFPLGSGGIPLTINVEGENSCGNTQFVFFSVSNNGDLQTTMNVTPCSNGYVLSLVESESNTNIDTEKIEEKEWEIEVYSTSFGTKIIKCDIIGKEYLLNTTDWESGIYMIRAVIDGEVHTQKITVK